MIPLKAAHMRKALLWLFGLRVLELKRGDILVIHSDHSWSDDKVAQVKGQLDGLRVKLLIEPLPTILLEDGDQLSVLRTGDPSTGAQ